MTDLHGRRSIAEIVKESLDALGGRAKRDELYEHVINAMTFAEHNVWHERALRQAIFSAGKTGVTIAGTSAVYGIGEEVSTLNLFSVEEFEQKATDLARLSVSNRESVFRLAEACEKVHGRTFDAEAILASVAA